MGKSRYGVILDAGSSGTRIYIYKWADNKWSKKHGKPEELTALPQLETKDKWTRKIHPGISTYGDKPEEVGSDYLDELLKHAQKYIPKNDIPNTPFFLLATAGVRLLPEHKRRVLLEEVCKYTKKKTRFLIPDCESHIQVIDGEVEGLYGWVAANYLVGGFDDPEHHAHGKNHHTYGFLDMGGASAQIAFAPNATEAKKHSDDLRLLRLRKVNGATSEYEVFVTTWLRFGVHEARSRYLDDLLDSIEETSSSEIPDPCLPKGLLLTKEGKILSPSESSKDHLIGTGEFDECLRSTYPLLGKDVPCEDEPCLLNGKHVPAIDFDVNHFIGISEYWHSTHEIFEMDAEDTSYDFNTYQQRVSKFCSQDWSAIEKSISSKLWGKKVDEQTAYEICFKASWLINMLHDGIGIPRYGLEHTPKGHNGTKEVIESGREKGYLEPFQAVNKIKHNEVNWALGKMVLYASSQIPMEEDALPVGFGSNEIGIPADFQYPGGAALIPTDGDSGAIGEWRDSLFDSDSPRRIPGFFMFLAIVCFAVFYLCGRDRRRRFMDKVMRGSGKRRSFLGSKLFPSRFHAYERVMEDGANLEDPDNFELGGYDSSEEDNKSTGKSHNLWGGSGGSSPKGRRGRRGNSGSMISTSGSMTDLSRTGAISPKLLDRQGVAVRTDSLERPNSSVGRKSRTASPNRLKTSSRFGSSLE